MKKRVYLFKSGYLRCQDSSLVYIVKDEKNYIPIIQTEIIYIFGNCTLNKSTIKILNDYNVKVYFFSYTGNYMGAFIPKRQHIGKLLLTQVALYTKAEELLYYQKEIIYSSIINMLAVLKYYNKKRQICFNQIRELEVLAVKVNNLTCDANNNLLILEARSKQIYYSSFNDIIINKLFVFNGRSTYPPKDMVNAMMSYGYALLYGIVETSLYTSNLAPELGIIHGISKLGNSLKYDIADIFKPVLIDRLIFRLINKKQINDNHFDTCNDATYLNKNGCSLFIEEFETQLTTVITIKNRKLSYRSIINREIYNIEKSLQSNKKYKGYKMEW